MAISTQTHAGVSLPLESAVVVVVSVAATGTRRVTWCSTVVVSKTVVGGSVVVSKTVVVCAALGLSVVVSVVVVVSVMVDVPVVVVSTLLPPDAIVAANSPAPKIATSTMNFIPLFIREA
jgi:hypothetical protein